MVQNRYLLKIAHSQFLITFDHFGTVFSIGIGKEDLFLQVPSKYGKVSYQPGTQTLILFCRAVERQKNERRTDFCLRKAKVFPEKNNLDNFYKAVVAHGR